MTSLECSIIIADDHPIVRSGLRMVFDRAPGMRVIHEAGNGDIAIQFIRQAQPDVVILDVEMPVMDGFAVARQVREESLAVHIIFMTMHKDEQTFNKAMEAGISGYVLKENAVADILQAVEAVMQGRHYISPSLSDYLMRRSGHQPPAPSSLDALTPTERRILRLIGGQKTSKSIAEELFISPKTVEKHRSNICAKLNLRGAYALLKFAMENKGIE